MIRIETHIISADEPQALEGAVRLLRAGDLVAFPTDTVYGLGAMLMIPSAIEQLYAVKGRDAAKAIAVLLGDEAALLQVAGALSGLAARLVERFWPGPLTLVVPAHPALPANLSSQLTVGVRMPDHPVALALLRRTGPLAVTSANRSGQPSARTAEEVYAQLNGRIPLILDGGETPGGLPSTVVDCTGSEPLILRQGPITLEQLFDGK
ncbi:MAG: threonylcarbamoyl-AMP synthase [Chloroflexi bacterium RBG_16_57_11]|nr:MAG: threonylcarbamoyl-AMP synthase [Chloroflexi bacterium RBG_16_57_11]